MTDYQPGDLVKMDPGLFELAQVLDLDKAFGIVLCSSKRESHRVKVMWFDKRSGAKLSTTGDWMYFSELELLQ